MRGGSRVFLNTAASLGGLSYQEVAHESCYILIEACGLLFHSLQSGEAYAVSRLGLEFRGPLSSVLAKKVDAKLELPVLQGVDPSRNLPLVRSVDGNQVNRLRSLAGVQLELDLPALAFRYSGPKKLDHDFRS